MDKIKEGPHAKRRGWLKNNNPPGDPSKAPRCGAKTRQKTSCRAPAMSNGRCRMHGGKSTGPKTPEGRKKCEMAKYRHGNFSKWMMNNRSEYRRITREARAMIEKMKEKAKSD